MNNNKYKRAKIYCIKDNTTENIYIGSTCKTITSRLKDHIRKYKQYQHGKSRYVTSYDILKNDNYNVMLLEEYKTCENKMQLHAKERQYIESMPCVNKVIPGRTLKEYYTQNKEIIKNKTKEYYTQNRDALNKQQKEIIHCPHCDCKITRGGKSIHEKTKKHINNIKII